MDRYDFFRKTVQGIPPYKVWRALNRLTPGTNWTGCAKTEMATAFSKPGYLGTTLAGVSETALTRAMDAERQTS